MKRKPVPTARPAFTLLEMVLAASITVLLLAALYVAVDVQLRHAATGREIVEQTTLVRTLVNRIANDIEPSVNLGDPSRFQQSGGGGGGGGGMSGGSGMSGGTGAASTGGSTTPTTGASGASGATGGTGTTTGSGATSSSTTTTTSGPPILLLQGTTDTLTIWVSRVPYNPNNSNNPNDPNSLSNPNAMPGFADTRRIDYWLAGGGGLGLARQEQTNITGDDALPGTMPPDVGDANSKLIIAPEVKSIQFQYFDGADWQDSWDGTQPGGDGVTPLGPPAAIAVTIGLNPVEGGEMKMYRHVIAIQTANGSTSAQISSTDGATTTVTTASSSSGNSAGSTSSSDSSGSGQ